MDATHPQLQEDAIMTEPTTQQMRDWLSAASPQTQIKYQWVDILLGRLANVEKLIEQWGGDLNHPDYSYISQDYADELRSAMGQSHD